MKIRIQKIVGTFELDDDTHVTCETDGFVLDETMFNNVLELIILEFIKNINTLESEFLTQKHESWRLFM